MDKNNIVIEALYEFKRVRRSILFQVFVVLAIVGLVVYQYTFLSREGGTVSINNLFQFYMDWTSQALSSSIAFKSAYYFNIIQLLLIACFAAGDSVVLEEGAKSALSARPQGNSEIVFGNFLGKLLTVTILNWISFATSILINLVLYSNSFDLSNYFFYWLTLTLPVSVYFLGISCFVMRLVRNRGIIILVLLLFFGGVTFFGAGFWNGVFDPCARYIPNMFSDFTGHVNLGNYLLQRGSVFLIGAGFLVLSIIPYARIPNHALVFRKCLGIACVLFVFAGGLVFVYHLRHVTVSDCRETYKRVYDDYDQYPGAKIIRQDLHLKELENGGISVNSRMKIMNGSSDSIPLIMYLNPGLKITSFEVNGESVVFRREHQILVSNKELFPSETYDVSIHYEGNIENEICFLDVAPEEYNSPGVNALGIYYFGNTPAFCGKEYKLLTPECIWYPVCVPPYHLSGSRNISFTRYSLKVEHDPRLTAISQGNIIEKGEGEALFRFGHDVPGVSLCIGNYEEHEIMVDSTRVTLYFLPDHDYLLDGYNVPKDTLAKRLLTIKKELEHECIAYPENLTKEEWAVVNEMDDGTREYSEILDIVYARRPFDPRQHYPYRWLVLVEVPCNFSCFPSLTQLTGEREQGGMVFMPEKLYTIKGYRHKSFNDRGEEEDLMIRLRGDIHMILGEGNCNIRPALIGRTTSIFSSECPIMNDIFAYMARDGFNTFYHGAVDYPIVEYLNGNSLRTALTDRSLSPDEFKNIMRKKSEELYMYIMLHVNEIQYRRFYHEFLGDHLFKETTLEEFCQQFYKSFGVRLDSLVESWYNTDKLPLFEIRDVRAVELKKTSYLPDMLYSFKVFNRGDVPGVIVTSDYQGWVIPPHEGREIKARNRKDAYHNYYAPFYVGMPLAQNLPAMLSLELESLNDVSMDTVAGVFRIDSSAFFPSKNEIVIDNEDAGFRVVQAKGFNILSLFRGDEENRKKYYKRFSQREKWLPSMNEHFYGNPIRSAYGKRAGSGEQKVEWSTVLPQEGKYEVFFYHTKPNDIRKDPKQEFHYVLSDEKGEHEVVAFVNADEVGWISLGVFDFTKKVKVTLSDKDRKNDKGAYKYPQEIVADAVKWVSQD
ncbi:golvesin C-terminal-like domain-containing protein [Butyricimonas muris]|uniref:golvesin C-terminal-like domain-containing protein n=1 Tax=Butyricimonas muris TaxID=3378067 RepID=UPI0039670CA3